MSNNITLEEDYFPEESKQLWDNITDYERLMLNLSVLPEQKKIKVSPFELNLIFIRTEIRRMIKNSELVVKTCDDIIATYTTPEEYIASDAKVARGLHLNLISRLKNVLEYKSAFDHEIPVEEENKVNTLYFDNTKRNR